MVGCWLVASWLLVGWRVSGGRVGWCDLFSSCLFLFKVFFRVERVICQPCYSAAHLMQMNGSLVQFGLRGFNVENEESSDSSHVVRGVVIGLSLVALVTLGIVGLFWYQRMQRRRYCSQEFLLGTFINYVLRQKIKGHFISTMILRKFQCITDQ